MRIAVATTLVLALSFLPSPASSQYAAQVGLSFQHGSLFDGHAFGMARPHATVSVGVVFGNAGYDGWDYGHDRYGYGSRRWSRYGGHGCVDVWAVLDGPYYGVYQSGFYDDWFAFSDLYYDCILRGPSWAYHRYHSYRPAYYHRPRYHRPRGIFISVAVIDPFWWNPYHPRVYPIYDDWGYYGPRWVVGGRAPRVRSVWAAPGPVYRRPSPIYVAGTTFKEDPQGYVESSGRVARPRNDPAGASAVVPPQGSVRGGAPRTGEGIQAPPRRTAGVGGDAVRAPETGAARRPTDPSLTTRPSDAAGSTRRGDPVTAPGPLGNVPATSQGRMRGDETARPSTPDESPARGREPVTPPAATQPDRGVRVPVGSSETSTERGRPAVAVPSGATVPTRPSARAPQSGGATTREAPFTSPTRSTPGVVSGQRTQQPTVREPQTETRSVPSRPSDRATGVRSSDPRTSPSGATAPEGRGSRSVPEQVRSQPSRSSQPDRVRSEPSRVVQPERSQSGSPRSQPAPSTRTAPMPRAQTSQPRAESPSTRSQPAQRAQPSVRQDAPQRSQPQERSQPVPSVRQSEPSRPAPARVIQPAPSRSSAPQASPSSGRTAPSPSAQPAPRRPGEETDPL